MKGETIMQEILELLQSTLEAYLSTALPEMTATSIVEVFKFSTEAFISLAYKYIEVIFN